MCEALGRGRQSIILRKGGIAEGREGFSFKHTQFYLFPTWFHEQPQKVREIWDGVPGPSENAEHRTPNTEDRTQIPSLPSDASIKIRYAANIDTVQVITSLQTAEALAPLHILQPDVVRERFQYDEPPGLQVALVRVFRIEPSWSFPNEPKYGGCKSWVRLPDAPNNLKLEPVVTNEEHARRREEFLSITSAHAAKPVA